MIPLSLHIFSFEMKYNLALVHNMDNRSPLIGQSQYSDFVEDFRVNDAQRLVEVYVLC